MSINNFYAGDFLHVDDICTVTKSQVSLVNIFARKNYLQLNINKCDIVSFSQSNKPGQQPHCEVNGAAISVRFEAKCPGYWWRNDLLASKSISKNIGKVRHSFFLHGSIGAFQSDLHPLSTRSIIETCVLSFLLSGCENWILSSKCHVDLELFVGEMSKRALKWSKHFSNRAGLVTLDLHSAKSYLLTFFAKAIGPQI